jgi:ATP-dependent Clp protease ATP-binding subunit ClpC
VIILTSNIGSEFMNRLQKIGFVSGGEESRFEDVKAKINDALRNHFRPEFLNRLDEIIIFNPLSESVIREIVDIQIRIVQDRLMAKGIKLDVTDEALSYLAKEGYSREYGARPLKRMIQSKILNPVAEFIIARRVENGSTITFDIKNGEPNLELKKPARSKVYAHKATASHKA